MQYYTTTQAFFNTFMVGCSGTTGSLSFDAEKLKFVCKALEKHFRSENFELYKGYVLWEIRSKSTKYSIFSARFVSANISSFWHIPIRLTTTATSLTFWAIEFFRKC